MQPPISLRLKRISDPLSDEQKMPPPKLFKPLPLAKKIEKVDLNTLDLIYVCNYCKLQYMTYLEIYDHWLNVHKKANNDATTQRFCYRVTQRVRCLLCPTANVTFQTIRTHMQNIHKSEPFAFAKFEKNPTTQIRCGICAVNVNTFGQLQNHFLKNHPQSQRSDMKIEPLPVINDAILEALLQQGDQGTFKCGYCHQHFPCRYDYDQHHQVIHGANPRRFDTNGKDVIKYVCNVCRQIQTDENNAIVHSREHTQQWYQCLHCPKKAESHKMIKNHIDLLHPGKEVGSRVINARDNLSLFYQMTLIFSNGLAMTWGDVLNTKYGGIERLIKYINDLNEVQRQEQLKLAGKVRNRRQTLL